MSLWTIASIIVLAIGAVVVALLVWDRRARGLPWRRDRDVEPDWLLPSPRDIREPSLDLAWQGYDPRQVDGLLEAVAAAYEELLLVAGPSAVARVERRLAERRGRELPTSAEELQDPGSDVARGLHDAPMTDVGQDLDAADGDAPL